jgi:hypothetical protein
MSSFLKKLKEIPGLQPGQAGGRGKLDVVREPNWNSFRKFWNDCDITITPILNGFVDIEGGHLGISGQWFNSCHDCTPGTSCEKCGRDLEKYLELRSGDGDGAYSVFEMWFDDKSCGALVVLDEGAKHAQAIVNSLHETNDKYEDDVELINQFETDLYGYIYDSMLESDEPLNMYFYGEVVAGSNPVYSRESSPTGILIFGESGEGIDSDQSLVAVNHMPQGTYRVFLFGQRGSMMDIISELGDGSGQRSTEGRNPNELALVPRFALVLHEDTCEQIGLTADFAERLSPSEEIVKWNNGLVMARIGGPLAPGVMMANMIWHNLRFLQQIGAEQPDELTALDMKLESLSWLLLLSLSSPTDELLDIFHRSIQELSNYTELIYHVRGQFGRRLQ